jgi:hypothetical protein
MHNDIDRIGMKVAGAKFLLGTCTDISALIGLSDSERSGLPIFSDSEVELLEHAVTDGIFKTMFGLPAARDGRKILAFVRAVKDAQTVGFSREWHRVNEESEWVYVRYAALPSLVTVGPDAAMRKMKELAAEFVAGGCDEQATIKTLAKAFVTAKNKTAECLERLWLELFEDHGVAGAVAYFRERWTPVDDATRDVVNAAFLAAKEKFKN